MVIIWTLIRRKKAINLPESSWGSGGHWQVWLNNATEWMWPIINTAEKQMKEVAARVNNGGKSDDLTVRAAKQLARELLLLESSDWPFLVTTGQAKDYALERFTGHQERFDEIYKMISDSDIDEGKLAKIEDIDNCFSEVSLANFSLQSKEGAVKSAAKG